MQNWKQKRSVLGAVSRQGRRVGRKLGTGLAWQACQVPVVSLCNRVGGKWLEGGLCGSLLGTLLKSKPHRLQGRARRMATSALLVGGAG